MKQAPTWRDARQVNADTDGKPKLSPEQERQRQAYLRAIGLSSPAFCARSMPASDGS